jgi:beta-lactamase class D
MKQIVVALALLLSPTLAAADCFIVKEGAKTLVQEGECAARYSPCSTFKIPLALMGFDAGILVDENNPTWDFKEEYKENLPVMLDFWNRPYAPASWMKNSAVWYSQVLTQELGSARFKAYVEKFRYGNRDLSGDRERNNGLTRAWLSSSLKISPIEQVAFLDTLLRWDLPVSGEAMGQTKALLKAEMLEDGWQLYGKTGSGNLLNADGSRNEAREIGWFIGWIEKDGRKVRFAQFIKDSEKQEVMAGKRARVAAIESLNRVIAGLR